MKREETQRGRFQKPGHHPPPWPGLLHCVPSPGTLSPFRGSGGGETAWAVGAGDTHPEMVWTAPQRRGALRPGRSGVGTWDPGSEPSGNRAADMVGTGGLSSNL